MILIVTDEHGESVYSTVFAASFDAATKRVTFVHIPPGDADARSLVVTKGRVQIIDRGSLLADWHPDGEPLVEKPAGTPLAN